MPALLIEFAFGEVAPENFLLVGTMPPLDLYEAHEDNLPKQLLLLPQSRLPLPLPLPYLLQIIFNDRLFMLNLRHHQPPLINLTAQGLLLTLAH